MDEYLILLLFLGILFALFFYRDEIFGKQQPQIVQPIRHKNKNKNKSKKQKYKKNKKHVETESDSDSDNDSNSENKNFDISSNSSKSCNKSEESYSKNSVRSSDTFPSIGSGLSQGDNKRDDDTF